jgi:hypothetical protein
VVYAIVTAARRGVPGPPSPAEISRMGDDASDETQPQTAPETPPAEPAREREVPRGCNPLVFGIVAATIQMGILLYFMQSC